MACLKYQFIISLSIFLLTFSFVIINFYKNKNSKVGVEMDSFVVIRFSHFPKNNLGIFFFCSKRSSGEFLKKLPKFTTRAYNMKGWSRTCFIFGEK
jgi:hypothetical protein